MAGQNLLLTASVAPKLLYSGALPSSLTQLYVVPSGGSTSVKTATVCNTQTSPVSVSLAVVPNGNLASSAYYVVDNYLVPGNDGSGNNSADLKDFLTHFLGPGDAIYALAATASVVNLTVSGIEST